MVDALSPSMDLTSPATAPGGGASLAKVFGAKEFNDLAPGTEFLDPEGTKRRKPYTVKDKASFDAVPDGMEFVDPDGVVRTKPAYEGVDFTTQTLHNMARTDDERRAVLTKRYGDDAVKESPDGLYAEVDGKRYRPGVGDKTKRAAALVASEAAPVGGSILGEIGGAALGTAAEPGAGTLAGAVGGGYAGGAAGQAFNDLVLELSGVRKRSAGQEARDIASAGIGGGVGSALGRAQPIAGAVGREALDYARNAAPRSFAKLAGATPEATSQAADLASRGAKVPPSSWLPELPYIHKLVETFDSAFRKQNVIGQANEAFYGREAGSILDDLGVPRANRESLTGATAKVSSERAGQMSLDKVRGSMAEEDGRLAAAAQRAKDAVSARANMTEQERTAAISQLTEAAASNRAAAQQAIDAGFNMIREDADKAVAAVGAGENPGDMVRQFAGKITSLRQGIRLRANTLYEAADTAAGAARPDVTELKAAASEFADSLPEPFKAKHPDIVKLIDKMENGQTTFGQLHNLRSMIRQDIEHGDLTPSMRDGALKMFSTKIDETLKAARGAGSAEGDAIGPTMPGEESSQLRNAYDILQKADAFYAKNMPRFQDEKVRGIVEATRAGMPMDAGLLAQEVFQPGYTERMTELRKIAGKPLWAAVQAADTKAMLDASKTLVPGEVSGGAFASQVLDRVKSGVLEAGYDKATADRLLGQAQRVLATEGKIPLTARPGDTVMSLMKQADDYLAQADHLAKTDPLGTLGKEIRRIDDEHRSAAMKLKGARKQDPLNFLFSTQAGPIKSADRILRDPDLMIAAAHRFGENSPEFGALRQVYAHRLLQRPFDDANKLQGDLAKITPEVQALVFPGVALPAAKQLAKDMNFLMGAESRSDTGGSMAAASRVIHPLGELKAGEVSSLLSNIPGGNTLGRVILGKYYQLMTWGSTHPAFIRWVEKGLQGDETSRLAVRDVVQRVLASGGTGGAIGAGIGAGIGEGLAELPPEGP